ncbi:hypothetical protein VARIO8X_110035 [Burkholderiales bacterium 8X]|nr:hypothetical protein VARIO8X_110035 [Burkholderiales bacterium 8X]
MPGGAGQLWLQPRRADRQGRRRWRDRFDCTAGAALCLDEAVASFRSRQFATRGPDSVQGNPWSEVIDI